ncbi:MAG: hypothetical protein LBC35_07305 [Coriobacteriales bacterium]|nr:hypothetical protein [Coriobacteriales bacterium]
MSSASLDCAYLSSNATSGHEPDTDNQSYDHTCSSDNTVPRQSSAQKGACWQIRGCDQKMASTCPHAIASSDGRCTFDCYYTLCSRPQHKLATNLDVLLDPTVDRLAAIKEICTTCEFFLRNGPRVDSRLDLRLNPKPDPRPASTQSPGQDAHA